MLALVHDSSFWVSLGGIMASITAAIRYLARVFYLYKVKAIKLKTQEQTSVENMRAENSIKLVQALRSIVEQIQPVVERHEAVIKKMDLDISNLAVIYSNTTDMIKELKAYHQAFEVRMTNVTSGAGLVMGKIKDIETEITELKSGNIFVRTKK